MSYFSGLFGTILPNVWTEDLSTGSKYDMSTSMMSLELLSSISVNSNMDFFTNENVNESFKWSVKNVKNALAYLGGIDDSIRSSDSFKCDCSSVVLLTS